MAKGSGKQEGEEGKRPIIIKKIKKGGHGHHGGAWKVAYADFVTAMMAFFLLLWLLNVTTEEQKLGISDYFNPTPQVSRSETGAGGMLGGLSISPDGAMVTDRQPPVQPPPQEADTQHGQQVGAAGADLRKVEQEKMEKEIQRREEKNFDAAKKQIEDALDADSELKDLKKNLVVDMTPEGLRIQIVDQEGEAMFPSGSAQMFDKTQKLMKLVGNVIRNLPNQVSVRGHTDSQSYSDGAGYTNWELSADRANASRKTLLDSGLPEKRINNVVGKADTDHFIKDKPLDPRNRRISIILLRDSLIKQQGANASSVSPAVPEKADPGYRPSEGSVNFP